MLEAHQYKEVQHLSGGMKRKLSLGMSLVGKSKMIILDEPTSGLDVDSRRVIWELIKKIKETRSVILSTQHIEEADVLADRVCIMSHGKVITLDTPAEIKRKYGVGYNIIVELKKENQTQNLADIRESPLRQKLEDLILKSNLMGATSSVELTDSKKLVFLVPTDQAHKLAPLMKQLEQISEILIAVEMTSLEEAYLRIVKKSQMVDDMYQVENDPNEMMETYRQTKGKESFTS